MEYPKWAPKAVCDRHREMLKWVEKHPNQVEQFEPGWRLYEPIYRSLVTDERMRTAWVQITKSNPRDCGKGKAPNVVVASLAAVGGAHLENKGAWELAVAMETASAILQGRQFQSRADKAQQHQRIAKLARDLARELKGSELDASPVQGGALRLLPDQTLEGLLTRFDPRRWEGVYSDAFQFVHRAAAEDMGITPRATLRDADGNRVGGMFDLHQNIYGIVASYLSEEPHLIPSSPMWLPSVGEVLQRLAGDADQVAKDAMREPRVTEKMSVKRPATHAVRVLAGFMYFYTGMAMQGTLANLVGAGLGIDYSDKDVQDALRGFDYKGGRKSP